jgi:hypothetical protein
MISTPYRPTTHPGSLRVSLVGEAANIGIEHLPFEVREVREDRSVVSVARGTLGGTIDLTPGNYVVTALAPDGQVLMTPSTVNVQSEQTAEARLEQAAVRVTASQPAGSDVTMPHHRSSSILAERVRQQISKQGPSWLKEFWTKFVSSAARLLLRQVQQKIDLGRLQELLTSQIERISSFESLQQMTDSVFSPSGPNAGTAAISWDILSRDASQKSKKQTVTPTYRLGPITVLVVKAKGRCVTVEDDQDNHLVAAVPYEESSYTVVACFRDPEKSDAKQPLRIEFYFPDLDTNALFRYMSRADFPEAGSMSSAILASYDRASDRTLKMPSKLATLFACYVLLRQNQLEPLRGFVDRLAQRWPQSPDAVAIRIETCARLGLHAEAAELCSTAPSLGVPMIASGIAYMQQRIRQYIEAATAPDGEEQPDGPAFAPRPELTTGLKSAWNTVTSVGAGLDARTLVTAVRVTGPYRD